MRHPKSILIERGLRAHKGFSQNFLTSPHWIEKLTDPVLDIEGNSEIWEIGPGLGALTGRLLEKSKVPLRVFEFDRGLVEYLKETYPELNIYSGDFLKIDWNEFTASPIAIISNLPYKISSPVLFKAIEHKDRISKMVVTFQREFADRLTAQPSTHEYGGLSVLMQWHFELKPIGVIPPGAFFPKPDIDSRAIEFLPIVRPKALAESMAVVVKQAFQQRRKKLANNLKALIDGAQLGSFLATEQLPEDVRPEKLTVDQFAQLANYINTL